MDPSPGSNSSSSSSSSLSVGGPVIMTLPQIAAAAIAATTATTSADTGSNTFFTYSIPGMDIAPGPLLFTYVSEFLSLITPEELPLDLVHEALHTNLTLVDFAANAIKIESGFVVLMSIFAILSLIPLIATCCYCCCRDTSVAGDVEQSRRAPIVIVDESAQESLNCRKSASVTTLWIVFLFLAVSDFCIFYANSRLATTIEMAPEMVKSTVHDMEVFLKDTHLQIKHKLDNGFHVSVEKVVKDLEDVDVLLGEPIQAEISATTGLELAFDSLATISLTNAELIYRVLMLQETVGRALKISQEAAARMEELQIQLSVLQRQCTYRDRPLCDTLRIRSFEENGIIDALKTLQEDQTIYRMRYLGEIEFGATVKNLTSEVGVSRSIFGNFPQQVKHDTAYERNLVEIIIKLPDRIVEVLWPRDGRRNYSYSTTIILADLQLYGCSNSKVPEINNNVRIEVRGIVCSWLGIKVEIFNILYGADTLDQLETIRHRTKANAQMLTATINALLERLQGTWETLQPAYADLLDWSNIYWTVGWVAAMLIIWVLVFMLIAYCCFLCESNVKAGFVLFVAVFVICASSVAITLYGLLTLAIGGNSQIFLCRPLYDGSTGAAGGRAGGGQAHFDMLGKLFDKPGYVYAREPQTGIIGELLRPAGVNRSIVNVSLAAAIRGCEENQASYNVFQLDAFVNTTQIADLKQFPKVTTAIDAITVSERTMLSLTQTVQQILEHMLHTSSFNLTTFRASIGAPTPEKDLATFIDQMQRVALQIQDVATSSRMTTLGSRSKRLQASILQPLEQLQNEILYHLTALELQRDPWAKQVNQTLNHLRNVQDYLEKTAGEICQNQTRIYTERLKTYLTSSKATMSSQLGDATAKCRPFYDIFDANRVFFCRNMVDYINALWFFAFLTLLLWSIGTPVGLNVITLQRKLNALRKAQVRATERSDSRGSRGSHSSRGRRHEREPSSHARERSTSSAARTIRPPLRRTATEETLDIADDSPQPRRERDPRSGEREMSRPRDMAASAATTPAHSRNHLQRSGNDVDDNWGSSGASRGTSMEREPSQPRVISSTQQRPAQTRPGLRKQGTESFDIDNEDEWQADREVRTDSRREQASRRNDSGRNIPKLRRNERHNTDHDYRRSITPIMPANPDAHQAMPLARTPTRLRNRVTLTTRALARIVRPKEPSRNRRLQRTGTEDFDLDESDTYGTSGIDSAAIAAARRTPPRTAPPPPPPPGGGGTTNRYGSVRGVRWNADDDVVFEDVD